MIDQEKYVKVVADPLAKKTEDGGVNNTQIYITENGTYEPERPYTGFDLVTVNVSEKEIIPLSITPTTSPQTFNPTPTVDAYVPVTVSAVDSSIDSNITADNIKSGVSILGVQGNVIELKGQTRDEYLTWYTGNVFEPNNGKNGITSIIVRPKNYTTNSGSYYIVTPTTSQQTVNIPNGYSGIGALSVEAVTSSIDANITAGNIKEGVTILGVTGTLPDASYPYRQMTVIDNKLLVYNGSTQNLMFGNTSFTSVGAFALVYAFYRATLTSGYDLSSLTTVDGQYAFCYAFSEATITGNIDLSHLTTVTGSYAFNYAFSEATITNGSVKLTGLVTLDNGYYAFQYAFYRMKGDVDLRNLETISGSSYGFNYAFQGMSGNVNLSSIKTVSITSAFRQAFYGYWNFNTSQYDAPTITGLFNSIESVTATGVFAYAFAYNPNMVNITFSKLSNLTGSNSLQYAFDYCTNLVSLSFPALTSASFGSYTNQFNNMLQGCSGVTVHFPSNLQSVIGSWTSVTGGFGGTNITVLFDLTATE